MATPYLNVYMNNPTEGEVDGTAVSTGGSFTAPLNITLDASQNEVKVIKCALRTEEGYITIGTTTISINDPGDRDRIWFSWTEVDPNNLDMSSLFESLSTDEQITAANKTFYVVAVSWDEELPQTDRSISLKVSFTIGTV